MAGKIVKIVKFGLPTCGPCKEQERICKEVCDEKGLIFESRDASECSDEDLDTFGVQSVPTVVFFDDDGDFITHRGFQTKDKILFTLGC